MAFGWTWRCLQRGLRGCGFAAAGCAAALTTAQAEPSGLPHADDELVIGVPQAITALHPLTYTLSEDFVLSFAHRRLAMPDQSWHLACSLCTVLPSLRERPAQTDSRLGRRAGHGGYLYAAAGGALGRWRAGHQPGCSLHGRGRSVAG
ncbi:MAG: hypothetical protein WDN69_03865 [Aliidongia sp.]